MACHDHSRLLMMSGSTVCRGRERGRLAWGGLLLLKGLFRTLYDREPKAGDAWVASCARFPKLRVKPHSIHDSATGRRCHRSNALLLNALFRIVVRTELAPLCRGMLAMSARPIGRWPLSCAGHRTTASSVTVVSKANATPTVGASARRRFQFPRRARKGAASGV